MIVRDLGSRNGVFVNGTKIAEHSLKPGDIVQIGPLRAQYVVDRAPLSIAPEDHDADRTAVISGAAPAAVSKTPAPTPVPPPPPVAREGASARQAAALADDDDATRLISARPSAVDVDATRAFAAPPPPSRSGSASSEEIAHEAELIEAPRPSVEASAQLMEPLRPSVETSPQLVEASHASMRSCVFLQLLVLGGLVLAATTLSFRADTTPSLTTFVVPAVVVAVGAYLVSGILDRRFTRAVAEHQQSRHEQG